MTEEKIDNDNIEVKVEVETAVEETNVETVVEETKVEVKTPSRKKKKVETTVEPQKEIEVKVESKDNSELDNLRAELEAMKAEKTKLEEERKNLNETVLKLQEEVKITPQKLGEAIRQMGVAPLSVTRENAQGMNIETYNSMTDTARREWQRTHRAEYLAMLHNVKLNSK
jgi:hypothetical protein